MTVGAFVKVLGCLREAGVSSLLQAEALWELRYGPRCVGEFMHTGLVASRAAATQLVNTLERKGMVRREHSVTARNQVKVRLTEKGAELMERAEELSQEEVAA